MNREKHMRHKRAFTRGMEAYSLKMTGSAQPGDCENPYEPGNTDYDDFWEGICWARDKGDDAYMQTIGWISCVDRLPVKSGPYWTFNGGDEKPSVIQQRVHMYDSDYKHFNSSSVTHWQPLPDPPA